MLKKYKLRTDLNDSFAVNRQLVLSMSQMGCGSTETGILFTYLDLPNAHAFHRTSFTRILSRMIPKIKNTTNSCMQ